MDELHFVHSGRHEMAPRAWTVIALGDDRQYGGNTGYSDEPAHHYSYDSAVNNHKQVKEGDLLFIRDRDQLLGIGTISTIRQYHATKERLRCPECNSTGLKVRKHKKPKWRCDAGHEFSTPKSGTVPVVGYEATYKNSFVQADGTISSEALKRAALRPNDQLSIEEIDPGRLPKHLQETAPRIYAAIEAYLQSHKLDARSAADAEQDGLTSTFEATIGDARDTTWGAIKRRRGQRKFRNSLMKRYGEACMISGCKILDVLEAAHISPFRGDADHHADNGLLLRADLHTLFDLHLLAVHPATFVVHVAPQLIESEYHLWAGTVLHFQTARRPAQSALVAKWKLFEKIKAESLS